MSSPVLSRRARQGESHPHLNFARRSSSTLSHSTLDAQRTFIWTSIVNKSCDAGRGILIGLLAPGLQLLRYRLSARIREQYSLVLRAS